MNPSFLNKVVDAVLYEGFILYPYRPSSKKNRRGRFTFGRVYPEAYSAAQNGAEPCVMQTECLAQTRTNEAALDVSVRFLHPMWREVGLLSAPLREWIDGVEPEFQLAQELRMDGHLFQTWQEAVEREVRIPEMLLGAAESLRFPFSFPASRVLEPIRDPQNHVAGVLVRRQESLAGVVEMALTRMDEHVFKLTVRVLNHTPMPEADLSDTDAVLMRTFASTHTILQIQGGEFLSLMDPSAAQKQAVAACRNIGVWPVLVGDEEKAERDTMLASPIILYDYPQLAPESPGNFFDGTEIDELLSLRILTMTDEEKREMRHVDEHARRLLERTETFPEEHMVKMHGVMRAVDSFDEILFGTSKRLDGVAVGDDYLKAGGRVRIQPRGRADVMDLALTGKIGVIEAIEQDAEGRVHLALVLEDDPGKDLGLLRQSGHRFFFGVEEIEPLREGE